MFPDINHIIFNFLDNEYPIKTDRIEVGVNGLMDFQAIDGNTTIIDIEITEIFGVPLDVYFWKWTESRIGSDVTIVFRHGEKSFNLGRPNVLSLAQVRKGIQATKIKNTGRWKPIT